MPISSTRGAAVWRRIVVSSALVAMAGAMSGCMGLGESQPSSSAVATGGTAASTGNPVTSAIFGAPNASSNGAIVVNAENFGVSDPIAGCPPLAIRPGTESMVVSQAGKRGDDTAKPQVQYQSSIVTTARECQKTATGVVVKVGVKGRTVAGPAGKAGTVNVPLRLVVMQGTDKVLRSDLIKIPVSLQAPDLSADFTKIVDGIDVPVSPGNTDFRIYVGFDDAPSKRG